MAADKILQTYDLDLNKIRYMSNDGIKKMSEEELTLWLKAFKETRRNIRWNRIRIRRVRKARIAERLAIRTTRCVICLESYKENESCPSCFPSTTVSASNS